jgi:hypothetical protein
MADMCARCSERHQSSSAAPKEPIYCIYCADLIHQPVIENTVLSRLEARIKTLEQFLREVSQYYDCDSDGHKYNTHCRACEARDLLNAADFKND